ncbi:MAG: 5'-nucleotidase [Ignisphaera sp.]|jgi:large subunit ribosomal protein L38e|nr:5'-nucleotidase [Ignisphaera sp.]MCC6055166.1 5'-nucleotidase [Desulfurococcaceae archaeon]
MPIYISSEQEFLDVAKRAVECRVKKLEKKNIAKIKARTKRYLYTYQVSLQELSNMLEKLKTVCKNIIEV